MERTEVFDPLKKSKLRAVPGYYFRILGGLYLLELLSPVLFFLPRPWIRGFNRRFINPDGVSGILMQSWTCSESLREIRTDGLLVLAGSVCCLVLR
jgi:hypothetical protein